MKESSATFKHPSQLEWYVLLHLQLLAISQNESDLEGLAGLLDLIQLHF